jgi:hypothetical protein
MEGTKKAEGTVVSSATCFFFPVKPIIKECAFTTKRKTMFVFVLSLSQADRT